ncbi:MAG: MBL fold metallo-hydrolase [Bacteroidota bacterium]
MTNKKIGKYELHTVISGTLMLDGGAMYGVVPKPLWERNSPADERNRIKLSTRHLLLVSDDKKIFIDTGSGKNWDEKFKRIYSVDNSIHNIFPGIEKYGVKREDITDVILTHLHFDHIGGAVLFENDKILPAFPNAKYHIQKKQFEWGLNPSERDKASYFKDRFVPLAEEGILNQVDGETNFDDNIELMVMEGHTFAQQIVKISDSSNTLLYCGDLIPLSSHINPPFIMGYDLQPLVTLEEKKKLLPKAVDEDWILFFEHDPDIAAAKITRTDKGFAIKESYKEI